MFVTVQSFQVSQPIVQASDELYWRAFELTGPPSWFIASIRDQRQHADGCRLMFVATVSDLLRVTLPEGSSIVRVRLMWASRAEDGVPHISEIRRVLRRTETEGGDVTHLLETVDGQYIAVPYGISTLTRHDKVEVLLEL